MNEHLRTTTKSKSIEILAANPQTVYTQTQIAGILDKLRSDDASLDPLSLSSLITLLVQESLLQDVRLEFPHRSLLRFLHGEPDLYELTQSLGTQGYLSHRSAAELHGLTEGLSHTYYVNEEQTPKPQSSAQMHQENIDRTFKKSARLSNNLATYGENRFYILNGKHTRNAGTVAHTLPNGVQVRVTGLERTIIDLVVRPFYAGGVVEVLIAFRKAGSKLDVESVAQLLTKLRYTYPYHQAIGFYMERSGAYNEPDLDIFRRAPREYDFYLDHKIKNPSHSSEWRIYYPKELDISHER